MDVITRLVAFVRMLDGSTYPLPALLSDHSHKFDKTNAVQSSYHVTGLSFAPASLSGFNVCQGSSAGCRDACLYSAGHGTMHTVQDARLARTRLYFQDRERFRTMLFREIAAARTAAARKGQRLAVRPNTLSDIPWERAMPELFVAFPDVQFFDYTKVAGRVVPANYHLTFSRSEANEPQALAELARGRNVTVVFDRLPLPERWNGFPVISGDDHDLRFLDPPGVVVGLYAKGKARKDSSGFVVPSAPAVSLASLRSGLAVVAQ